ncbi:MAG: hypothetical protein OEW20_05095, partial [Nitrospira sp.]|nr:hypothetical protein [Nitrospira sp.]
GMSATDSERTRKSGRLHLGISGRVPSERVADLRRNTQLATSYLLFRQGRRPFGPGGALM